MDAQDVFFCEKLTATLKLETCKDRHLSGKYHICKNCGLGAEHAGVSQTIDLSHVCSRCGNFASRLILKRLCLSCYNRTLEVELGKNRRGNAPRLKIEPATVNLVATTHKTQAPLVKVSSLSELYLDAARQGLSVIRHSFVQVDLIPPDDVNISSK